MPRSLEMLQCVSVLGILAAANVTTCHAQPQRNPLRTDGEAFLATVGPGRDRLDHAEVLALFCHRPIFYEGRRPNANHQTTRTKNSARKIVMVRSQVALRTSPMVLA